MAENTNQQQQQQQRVTSNYRPPRRHNYSNNRRYNNNTNYYPNNRPEEYFDNQQQSSFYQSNQNTNYNQYEYQQQQQPTQQYQQQQQQGQQQQPQQQQKNNYYNNQKKQPQQNQQKAKKSNENKKVKETRSDILIEQLLKNKCECLVCCSIIKSDAAIWNCTVCYQLFHIYCIKKWATSSVADASAHQQWRCPYCQTANTAIPNKYMCFCGKTNEPIYNKNNIPHSCGEVCGKPKSSDQNCIHKCSNLCHPGPCGPCEVTVTRSCGCGRVKYQVKCNSTKTPECENVCGRMLNCKRHECTKKCHNGTCSYCDVNVEQFCYSHSNKRILKCGQSGYNTQIQFYSCDLKCGKLLSCGFHRCDKLCHEGDCGECLLSPERLKTCPCGRVEIKKLLNDKITFKKCTDPIPTCDNPCDKLLKCSGIDKDDLHVCKLKCHNGDCSLCEKIVEVKCRCRSETEMLKCFEAQTYKIVPKLCKRKCNKKKTCGRHKCTEACCNYTDHLCTLICGRDLTCGLHKCEQLCHKGNCPNCLIASFEELTCNCGKTIMYPPIRCGTRLPECTFPCQREHECDHPIQHNCHNEEKCPPCNFLTSKMCMGNHVLRNNIPCYMKDVSCGLQCGRELPCGQHVCLRTCHKGECLNEGEVCKQPCQIERPHCIHPCLQPCHINKSCPDTVCQADVVVKCNCGLKTQKMKCLQKTHDVQGVIFENLASEIKEMLSCQTIDIDTFRNTHVLKKKHELACDEDCLIAERNRNLTDALQIDTTNKKTLYTDFLKTFARDDLDFVLDVEKTFAQLIKETNNSVKIKKFEATFPIMKSLQRKFIHEFAGYYGFSTQSYDKEPNRTIKVFAIKDQCHVPNVLLSQSVEAKVKQTTIMPHVSNINKELKIQKLSNMYVLNPESPIEVKQSKYAILENWEDDLSTENKDSKHIDYFDFTE